MTLRIQEKIYWIENQSIKTFISKRFDFPLLRQQIFFWENAIQDKKNLKIFCYNIENVMSRAHKS